MGMTEIGPWHDIRKSPPPRETFVLAAYPSLADMGPRCAMVVAIWHDGAWREDWAGREVETDLVRISHWRALPDGPAELAGEITREEGEANHRVKLKWSRETTERHAEEFQRRVAMGYHPMLVALQMESERRR